MLNNQLLTSLNIFNELCIIDVLDHDINEDYNDFLILKKLLLDVERTKKFEQTNLNDELKKKHLKHTT